MLTKIRTEPALVIGFISALLGLVMAFGLKLSVEQVAGIGTLTTAILAFITRQLVSPVYADQPVA